MVVNGNALHIPLANQSVHCIVTSPPYWGLRDYGTATWQGGDENCKHNPQRPDGGDRSDRTLPLGRGGLYRDICGKCGAIRIDNQLGLERTPEEYVANMVQVFRECWRVLRDDGTLWLNLGDSYSSGGRDDYHSDHRQFGNAETRTPKDSRPQTPPGLKPKDLVGIPWRVAFALQADGWYLRSDIIWSKPNPMPESVTDRPTKSHEYLFLLAKRERYYYDAEAVREPHNDINHPGMGFTRDDAKSAKDYIPREGDGARPTMIINKREYNPAGRNRRTVWTIPTAPYSGAHFATFPPALVEPCIKAGTSERGVCPKCGKPWKRVIEISHHPTRPGNNSKFMDDDGLDTRGDNSGHLKTRALVESNTTGWLPTCLCYRATSSIIEYKYVIREWFNDDKNLFDLWERNICEAIERGKNKVLLEGVCDKRMERGEQIAIHTIQKRRQTAQLQRRKIYRQSRVRIYKNNWTSDGKPKWICSRTPPSMGAKSRYGNCAGWLGSPSYQWFAVRQSTGKFNGATEKESQSIAEYQTYSKTPEGSGGGIEIIESTEQTFVIPYHPTRAIVFDPFAGSGTTIKVAYDLGRRGVGLDLSMAYLTEQATTRIHNGHTARLL